MRRGLLFLYFTLVFAGLSANDVDIYQFGDVIINEVMADPTGLTDLAETEYVEIYNASGNDLSLSGWKFVYDSKESTLPDVILPSGGYAVLYRSGRDITVAPDALLLGMEKFPSALANTGKTIGLKSSKDLIIDEITYPKASPGESYERSDDGTWHLSTDEKGGTPGAVNSPALSPDPDPDPNPPIIPDNSVPGDVIINEVMADPVGLTELPETEYVEIYNASANDLSLSGWKFI
ncbi:MAG: lamin tail domain-containing protein, partial [Tannerella sp.]|nr:lamin tail domain-containing protein [Tannerella sp.]